MGDRLRPVTQMKEQHETETEEHVGGCLEEERDVIEGAMANIIR